MSNYIKRPLRHITGWLWPGYLAEHDAKAAFAIYRKMWSIERLRDAVDWYQLAVDQRRKHNHHLLATTLVSCAATVWVRYSENGMRPEDLTRAISLGDEALSIWPQGSEPDRYAVLLDTLGSAWVEKYRISTEHEISFRTDAHAFDMASKYLHELTEIEMAPLLQRKARMQLGTLIRMRCELMLSTESLDIGVDYLEGVYHEVQMAVEKGEANTTETKKDMENVIATCVFNLAVLYELRYKLVAENDDQRLAYLSAAIDYNTQGKALFETYHRRERTQCVYNLARQLFLRWRMTRSRVDIDTAIAMTEVAKERVNAGINFDWIKKFNLLHAVITEDNHASP